MSEFVLILLTTTLISLIAFVGVLTLALRDDLLDKILLLLVSLSAGALMGGAFIHLLPEALEKSGTPDVLMFVLVGFVLFFIVEKFLFWRHCHKGKCDIHTFSYMNLIGDAVHNFIDGLIIAVSFVVSVPLGLTTTIAIAAHEIPQEIGDFGVLIYGGIKKRRALALNFIVALTVVIGGVVGYFASSSIEEVAIFLLPFAAGGFIYIAATDLIPEIRSVVEVKKSLMTLGIFIIGILLMWSVKLVCGG